MGPWEGLSLELGRLQAQKITPPSTKRRLAKQNKKSELKHPTPMLAIT